MEPQGEQYFIAPNNNYRLHYINHITPDELLFVKCFGFGSRLMTEGKTEIAHDSGHTAFMIPEVSAGAPARQGFEVLCLVFSGRDEDVGSEVEL
jgi:hypothetical protein